MNFILNKDNTVDITGITHSELTDLKQWLEGAYRRGFFFTSESTERLANTFRMIDKTHEIITYNLRPDTDSV